MNADASAAEPIQSMAEAIQSAAEAIQAAAVEGLSPFGLAK